MQPPTHIKPHNMEGPTTTQDYKINTISKLTYPYLAFIKLVDRKHINNFLTQQNHTNIIKISEYLPLQSPYTRVYEMREVYNKPNSTPTIEKLKPINTQKPIPSTCTLSINNTLRNANTIKKKLEQPHINTHKGKNNNNVNTMQITDILKNKSQNHTYTKSTLYTKTNKTILKTHTITNLLRRRDILPTKHIYTNIHKRNKNMNITNTTKTQTLALLKNT